MLKQKLFSFAIQLLEMLLEEKQSQYRKSSGNIIKSLETSTVERNI
jgi:hypothetical protein